jgi:hypothetical protein
MNLSDNFKFLKNGIPKINLKRPAIISDGIMPLHQPITIPIISIKR